MEKRLTKELAIYREGCCGETVYVAICTICPIEWRSRRHATEHDAAGDAINHAAISHPGTAIEIGISGLTDPHDRENRAVRDDGTVPGSAR